MNITAALFLAALGAVLLVWVLVSLTRRLRQVRAAQPPGQRSSFWVLFAGGLGAWVLAYFAFGENLQAVWLFALAVLAVASVPLIRRLLP